MQKPDRVEVVGGKYGDPRYPRLTRIYEGHLKRLEEIYSSRKNEDTLQHEIDTQKKHSSFARISKEMDQKIKLKEIDIENRIFQRRLQDIKEGHYVAGRHPRNPKSTTQTTHAPPTAKATGSSLRKNAPATSTSSTRPGAGESCTASKKRT